MLLKAIECSKNLEAAIYNAHKNVEKLRKDKFRSMMSVLTQYPHLRTRLLSEELSGEAICKMKRDDFLSTELKR